MIPIDIAGFELRGGCVTTIRGAQCRANSETFFGKIQAVTTGSADAVEGRPLAVVDIDAAGEN